MVAAQRAKPPVRGSKDAEDDDDGGYDWQADYASTTPSTKNPSPANKPRPPSKGLPPNPNQRTNSALGIYQTGLKSTAPESYYADNILPDPKPTNNGNGEDDESGGYNYEDYVHHEKGHSESDTSSDDEDRGKRKQKGSSEDQYTDIKIHPELAEPRTDIPPCRTIDFKELELKKQIGAGSFGTVYKVGPQRHKLEFLNYFFSLTGNMERSASGNYFNLSHLGNFLL